MLRFVFLLPTLFSGLCRVRFGHSFALHSQYSHRKTLVIPSKRDAFLSLFSFRKLHFIRSFKSHPCPTPQKNSTSRKKRASPACST
jgi:hypothetical protein